MKTQDTLIRIGKLILGLFIVAVSIVLQINANLGYAPWTVFSDGLRKLLHITIGRADILISIAIICIDFAAKEKIGFGTICNMILIGLFTDWIIAWNILPKASGLADGLLLILVGMIFMGIGCYFYIGAGYGAGPRDSLMLAMMKYTGKSLGICRSSLEIMALVIGYLLGGSVGVGTVVLSLCTGYIIQFVFRLAKFDAKAVHHQYIDDQIKSFFRHEKAA